MINARQKMQDEIHNEIHLKENTLQIQYDEDAKINSLLMCR